MEKKLPLHLQEVIFGSSDSNISKRISKLEKAEQLRKIAPRLYTTNFEDSAEVIVRRNLFSILGNLYPGAVLSHRSAFEFQPTSSGQIFLTYSYTRKTKLPGLTIRFLKGPDPIEGDSLLSGDLYVSQRERALLENLQSSRKKGPDSKTLTYPELEERLEQIVRVNGEEELNKVRNKARNISRALGMTKEFERLDAIISALLATHTSKVLKSPVATARAFGIPYDPYRYELFGILYRELEQFEFRYWEDKNNDRTSFKTFAFFESYFSNYIEGTVFEIDEAKRIVASGVPMPARQEDSHDILGTYRIVSNKKEMRITPSTPEELITILKYRHKILMSAREDKKPGEFKDKNNRAGQTSFVDIDLVIGTLIKCFDFYNALKHPFAKAAYIMFAISEIHPFADGNGRIARIMMNAELVKENQARIIIPTVYRDDYLLALRKLTRQAKPAAYIRMLSRIHEYSYTIVGPDMGGMQLLLEESNAFLEHDEARLKMKNTGSNN
ncbi:MAG: Fic family protein [Bacteroidetes bacterium]|nr:Fic family protein [Bacteroidota bacterium]